MALKHPFETPVAGIDVSKYQGNVDWPKVKAAGYAFAFVRLGYANGDGTIVLDPYFERNVTGAAAAGLDVGVYLYSYLNSEDHARMAATRVLELIAEHTLTMPVVLDYEHGSKYASYGRDKNSAICNAFLRVIAKAGYLPMYYSYKSFCDNYMNMAALEQYEGLWIANYTGKIGVDNAAVWQHSSTGKVPGVPGRCDMNHMYCDLPRTIREEYTHGAAPEFEPLTNKRLDVFGTRCEYFTAPDINAVVMQPDGSTAKLPVGAYDVKSMADGLVDGYPMVQIEYQGKTVYAAILDDRCRLVDGPANSLTARLSPMPNEGDRKNIENYCKSLGIAVDWLW